MVIDHSPILVALAQLRETVKEGERKKLFEKIGTHITDIDNFLQYAKSCGSDIDSCSEDLIEVYYIWSMGRE